MRLNINSKQQHHLFFFILQYKEKNTWRGEIEIEIQVIEMKISITLNRLLQATKERKKRKFQPLSLHVELPGMSPGNEPEQKT